MVHPATTRAVTAAVVAVDTPLEVGFVFPPKQGEERGHGVWTHGGLSASEIVAMLPRAAAANVQGAAIYIRLAPEAREAHPGIVLVDDLTNVHIKRLAADGLEPCLVVETSPGNYQAWIRLVRTGPVPYPIMNSAARYLAREYNGDPRAVSPRQPGRLPGFTNRKPKYMRPDGSFPFVRLIEASPGLAATNGRLLLNKLAELDTAGAARGAPPETPLFAARLSTEFDPDAFVALDKIYQAERRRIYRQLKNGQRSAYAASASEIDFAAVTEALRRGVDETIILNWLAVAGPAKHPTYAARTLDAAKSLIRQHQSPSGQATGTSHGFKPRLL